jgi:hypothetical protein
VAGFQLVQAITFRCRVIEHHADRNQLVVRLRIPREVLAPGEIARTTLPRLSGEFRGEPEPGDQVVLEEDGDGAHRALTKAKVLGGQVEHHALCVADLGRGRFGLGEVAAADQQRSIRVSSTKNSGGAATYHAGAADEQNRIHM